MLPSPSENSCLHPLPGQTVSAQPLDTFDSFNLADSLKAALKEMGISQPTPVQAATMAIAIEGRDVMASAQTGTGKTLAYTLPLMVRLLASPNSNALVLAPTRELATQVKEILRQLLGKQPALGMALLIGGESMGRQFDQLKRRPRIIVGTPGRICDHLTRGSLSLKNTTFLAIDEADRMLDMGFSVQLDKIATYLPAARQTLMFSATMPGDIVKLSQKYLQNPARVCVDSPTKAAPKIKQEIIRTTSGEKYPNLIKELNRREGSVIIFVKTKRGADQLADRLRREDLSADSIHGDLNQRQRDRAIAQFRNNNTNVLVATDVAARGLDIPHIRHVINYDLPQCAEDFIHRIGRTARAGSEGNALSLICPDDNSKWNAIDRLMNPGAASSFGGKGPQGRINQGRGNQDRVNRDRPASGRASSGRGYQNSSSSRFSQEGRPDSPRSRPEWEQGGYQGRPDFPRNKPQWFQNEGPAERQPSRSAWDKPTGARPAGNRKDYPGQVSGQGSPSNRQPWSDARKKPSGFNSSRPSTSGSRNPASKSTGNRVTRETW